MSVLCSVHKDARLHPAEQHLHDECLQSVPVPRDGGVQTHGELKF